ncbi:hypothetical protein [Paenibacillus glucanolyticus]|uniref:hypothetical protein n=1 Tax=Paenibacillus glucanolyticus TaxID=59843 RepID=UPI00096F7059|nr:hypothetical protein [Paenibacillus glucanolyticus]OMF76722.1 hypothetical protein BK142_14470 [Paenibacillus glucanolyticus]
MNAIAPGDICSKEKPADELAFFDVKCEEIQQNGSHDIHTTLCLDCKHHPHAQIVIHHEC